MADTDKIAITSLPFWSRFLLPYDTRYDGTNGTNVVITRGTEIAIFDYRRGALAPQLGGAQATPRDTILTSAAQTRGGEQYIVKGISLTKDGPAYLIGANPLVQGTDPLVHQLVPGSSTQPANGNIGPVLPTVEDQRSLEAMFWAALQKYCSWVIQIDGTKRTIELGATVLYPGVNGPSDGNVSTNNGGTFVQNYWQIPETIEWQPAGSADSNFVILLTFRYDVVLPAWTAPNGLNPAGDPIDDAVPTPLGRQWKQGWICNLHGKARSPLSAVS